MVGYPGVWECPSGQPSKDATTVCCNICPAENYPEIDLRQSTSKKPYDKNPKSLDPDEGCPVAKKCGSNRKAGTNCDPTKPKCPMPPEPFPGTDAPCCTLCTESFIPEKSDPIVDENAGESYPDAPIPFKADENGYILPDLSFLEVMSRIRRRVDYKKTRTLSSADSTRSTTRKTDKFKRCCYACAASDYNASPGNSVFGEPQPEAKKLQDLFRPLNMPYKNFVNQRDDYTKEDKGGIMGGLMGV